MSTHMELEVKMGRMIYLAFFFFSLFVWEGVYPIARLSKKK